MNFKRDICIVKYSFSLMGLWPEESSYGKVKFTIVLGLNIIGTILNLIRLVIAENNTDRLENMWYLFAYSAAMIGMCVVKKNMEKLIIITNWIEENWYHHKYLPQKAQIIMHRQSVKARKYILVLFILVSVSILCALFGPMVTSIIYNMPLTAYSDKGWYSFSVKKSPAIEIIYILRGLSIINSGLTLCSIQCSIIFIILHICGQINVLCYTITTYKESAIHNDTSANETNYCNCLRCIINRHNSIVKISTVVEDYANLIYFIKFITNGIQICISGTLLITNECDIFSKISQNIIYFSTYSWGTLYVGWLGDQLTQHGYKIGDVIYSNNWYESRQLKIRQIFSIIICRARRPIKITAGKYFAISLKTIGQLYLTWISYVSVLNAVKSSQK